MKTNLKQLPEEEITMFIERLGQKPYRARQIINWIYKKLATSFDEMTDLSKNLQGELKKIAFISNLNLLQRQVSKIGTSQFRDSAQKFLFRLDDGETIESVLIPDSQDRKRLTLCISSQAGCAMGCRFCITGKLGLKRNLKAYEIVDQVIVVERHIRDTAEVKLRGTVYSIANIVFMGMGEPLHNFDEVVHALWKIMDLQGFSKRRITVSTAGITPGIHKLAKKCPGVNLAVSLNATTDEVRNKIMPINKKYPLKELLSACREVPLSPGRRITFEYVLLDRINDSKEDALRLVKLLKGIKSKVNLIPYNPIQETSPIPFSKQPDPKRRDEQLEFRRPSEDKIFAFKTILLKAGITALIRKSKGTDISAACGQLRACSKIS